MDNPVCADAQPSLAPRPITDPWDIPDGMTVFAMALYKPEAVIARDLGFKASDWGKLAPQYEREGLPKIDPLAGMRYWPAVKDWFDRRHGVAVSAVPAAVDGPERW